MEFGRELCNDLNAATAREWLVTNGLGGYAAGTVSGVLTRRYHGLLIAALNPPVDRALLLARLDETVTYRGILAPLFTNQWASGLVEPHGYRFLDSFALDAGIPTWRFTVGDALLEKRLWMQQGANTTYVQYRLLRASAPLDLELRALVNHRDHHGASVYTWPMGIHPVEHGLRIESHPDAAPFYLIARGMQVQPEGNWFFAYYWAIEDERGLDVQENLLHAGTFTTQMREGDELTMIASTESDPGLDGGAALRARQRQSQALIREAGLSRAPEPLQQLALAADQFIVGRRLVSDVDGRSVIAGYPWFADWGRDTMISLPGLVLATHRYELAARILRTFAAFVDQGMLPNHFPEGSAAPEYNTVDATLWYFEAIRAYHAATGDLDLLRDLFPVLKGIIEAHERGARFHIHVDTADGLLYAGEEGVQLTWMDARVEGREITPRTGKPVEINALWYNALCSMAEFAALLGQPDPYTRMADHAQISFARFWNAPENCLFDVIDGPEGPDASLRPNQLFAISLHHSPLNVDQARAVLLRCEQELFTPHGLRSLSAAHMEYSGSYLGSAGLRDSVYHQGTVWAWLIGPFVEAHFRVHGDKARALSFLDPLLRHLQGGCLGTIGEVFDGDAPHHPRGAFAQAWSVAELLRVWRLISEA